MLFRRFSLPGEVSFENTIQKHDANTEHCTNSLLDRIGRFTTDHHILPLFVCKMVPTPPEPSSLVAETAEVYGSG